MGWQLWAGGWVAIYLLKSDFQTRSGSLFEFRPDPSPLSKSDAVFPTLILAEGQLQTPNTADE